MRKTGLRFTWKRRSRCLGQGAYRSFLCRCSRPAPVIAALENGTVEVLDIRKGKRSTEIKGLGEPQGVFYSSRNGGVTTIPLNSHPESFQLEEGDPRIFVN